MISAFADGSREQQHLLGNKGAGLAELTRLGFRVPDGFTLTTAACRAYYAAGQTLTSGLREQIVDALAGLERRTGKRLGDPSRPLLLAVRSGAPESMPGMMDTVLNLGLNRAVVQGLAGGTGHAAFAADCERRFRAMYGAVVSAEIPESPLEQLLQAVSAVFDSWNNRRAAVYRRIHGIPEDAFTAVSVQEMVFGNLNERSAAGVVFSRHPASGEPGLHGEILYGAQGEDVVSGAVTPERIETLRARMPLVYAELELAAQQLEAHYQDMQEIEFTVQDGVLYLLQTRDGKRTTQAAVQIAVDLVQAGVIDRAAAVQRVDLPELNRLLQPRLDPAVQIAPLATGIPAVPGAAVGRIALDAERVLLQRRAGQDVLLVRRETDPDDYEAMTEAQGILTAFGGTTSHAAVTALPLGKPCIVGCSAVTIDLTARTVEIGGRTFVEGDVLTLDGSTGKVYADALPLAAPKVSAAVDVFRSWLQA
ncbi:pyruvate,phosphate dikinase [Tumebacillus sp. BK434]|uniref:pyruvate, phosphate dikinase n=1 Tax=Tumebacillus sp. BK434 TaxID=2512169 RepID=UPI0010E99323|nr:pyruvate, phosphate dikinase [Tumebacillus sp. BK434]TCP53335.1 pyruvate,phosphate dikinase [Tumebacillus sp. BK434]